MKKKILLTETCTAAAFCVNQNASVDTHHDIHVAMVKKKVDERIRTVIENGIKTRQRSIIVCLGTLHLRLAIVACSAVDVQSYGRR